MFISIVTVVFNGEKTIERTLQSVLNQQFDDYEYIIHDGGSTDKTIEIVESYRDQFGDKLKVYSELDKGIYDAMNKGIKHSLGDYIWLVNADDWITDDALDIVYSTVLQKNLDNCIISGAMNLIDPISLNITRVAHSNTKGLEMMDKTFKMGVAHPSTIVSKTVYRDYGLYDDRFYIAADLDFVLRMKKQGIPFIFIDKILSNFRIDGVSNQFPINKNMHDYCMLFDKHIDSFIKRFFLKCKFFVRAIVLYFLAPHVNAIVNKREALKCKI